MNPMHRSSLVAAGIAVGLTLGVGCKPAEEKPNTGEADKKAREAAAATLKQPVALIAAYLPYVSPGESKDKYASKRRSDATRATTTAADEVRHAANGARQKLDSGDALKELVDALGNVAAACTDVQEPTAADKCVATVNKLEEALKKAEAASAAANAPVKFPHVSADAITPEARAATAPFMKAKGPGDAEKAYIVKRHDPAISTADLVAACQAAADEASAVSMAYAKAEEPLRLVAVTHQLALDSQCRGLTTTEGLRKDLNDCRKKAKSTDCKVVCAKVKAQIEDGLPAATFTPMEKDATDICGK